MAGHRQPVPDYDCPHPIFTFFTVLTSSFLVARQSLKCWSVDHQMSGCSSCNNRWWGLLPKSQQIYQAVKWDQPTVNHLLGFTCWCKLQCHGHSLFIARAHYYLVVCWVDCHWVHVTRVGQVSDAPLKRTSDILANKDWLHIHIAGPTVMLPFLALHSGKSAGVAEALELRLPSSGKSMHWSMHKVRLCATSLRTSSWLRKRAC